jgi:TolB-like protein/Flp pilus assembly protein TadD
MNDLWTSLKQRKLFQWGAAYLAGAWVATEVLDLLADRFYWSEWFVQAAVVALAFGFLGVLTLAWYHGERGRQRISGGEFVILVLIAAGAALGIRSLPSAAERLSGVGPQGATTGPGELALPALSAAAGLDFRSSRGSPRVAVLPFRNVMPDPEADAYLVEGLHDEITSQVSKVGALEVVARSSALRFGEREDLSAQVVGDSLGARFLVEGSVRRAGDRLRVSVTLVDASADRQLWSEVYDREATVAELFDVQADIALNVAESLEATLFAGETERIRTRGTDSDAAYEAYLRGRQHVGGAWANYPRMAELFQQAVDLDPDYAEAWSSLGLSHVALGNFFLASPQEAFPRAREAANRALALDSTLAEAHSVLAWVHFAYDRDWAATERELQIAEALDPGLDGVFYLRAYLLQALGRFDEALVAANRMLELDPVGANSTLAAGRMLHMARRYEEALALFRRAERLNPEDSLGDEYSGITLAVMGRMEEAIPGLQSLLIGDRVPAAEVGRLTGAYETGGPDGVWRLWVELTEAVDPPRPGSVAMGYARQGRAAEAVEWLRRAAGVYDSWVFQLSDPLLDPVRGDPAFVDLLEGLGLPAS